ncbi:endonuclease domain-containing protein [Inediibacterium massiliense]|uniref:endonuclease domain-containing protein n=1 Tax=Inediibacterium massiliense TaxID=1658111 RepID=UPI0006B49F70|nr:ORF6N domain-containing protein [Inediibacterium massiliense]
MVKLKIIGKQNVSGMEFIGIEGGFGEGKKAMLAKDISKLHGKTLDMVNRAINRNRNRFKDNIDIIDLKTSSFEEPVSIMKKKGIYTQNSINASKNIYLLSLTGYIKLLNVFEDGTIGKKVLKEYFNYNSNCYAVLESRKEILFRNSVEKTLKGICDIIPQYYVDGYRIDIYIPQYKLAIEYDEKQHKYQRKEDIIRQKYIENKLGCKFIRIDENANLEDGLNKVLKYIIEEKICA